LISLEPTIAVVVFAVSVPLWVQTAKAGEAQKRSASANTSGALLSAKRANESAARRTQVSRAKESATSVRNRCAQRAKCAIRKSGLFLHIRNYSHCGW